MLWCLRRRLLHSAVGGSDHLLLPHTVPWDYQVIMTYIGPTDTQAGLSLVETLGVPSTVRLKISLGSKPGVSVLALLTPGAYTHAVRGSIPPARACQAGSRFDFPRPAGAEAQPQQPPGNSHIQGPLPCAQCMQPTSPQAPRTGQPSIGPRARLLARTAPSQDKRPLVRTWALRDRKPHGKEASRGFEPQSLDSGSRVLTVTPRGQL